ncbi:MAG: FG-GAP-like repeat-containing protein [Limisphaerales bacterium]
MEGEGYRSAPLAVQDGRGAGFTEVSGVSSGVLFTNVLAQTRYLENINLLNGSGVALGDYDGDGRCDIFLCGLEGASALYRNLGGWRFEDVTSRAGVGCVGQTSTGAAFADVDGDGDLDLLVNSMGGPNALLLNDGRGVFKDVTAASGLVSKLGSTSMALADVDGDGDLDLYVANYGVDSILRSGGRLSFRVVNGRRVATGRYAKRIQIIGDKIFELGEQDVLYLNDGAGRFSPVAWTEGAFLDEEGNPLEDGAWDQSLSVLMQDFNGDGAPDIYVCSDASGPDRFWINDGGGRFRAIPTQAIRTTPYFSMSVAAGDFDRDGLVDLFATDMLSREHVYVLTQKGNMHEQLRLPGDDRMREQERRNVLLRARADGTYAELAWYAGIAGSEWAWSCLNLDVDLDGWEDLLISNGHPHNSDDMDTRERIRNMGRLGVAESRQTTLLFERLATKNLAYRNSGDLTFEEVGDRWGFNSRRISHGMATGDLDGDGDLDVVVNCFQEQASVLRNEASAGRVTVRLRGKAPNTQGIGARIRVSGGPTIQEQEMLAGGRYMAGDQPLKVFAAGKASKVSIEVIWRSGVRSVMADVPVNRLYEITEPAMLNAVKAVVPGEAAFAGKSLFSDVSEQVPARHQEVPFDDLLQQPLLPYQLSRLGAGLGWVDLDGDDVEELVLPGDMGGEVVVMRWDEAGRQFVALPDVGDRLMGDGMGVALWTTDAGDGRLLVGMANPVAGDTVSGGVGFVSVKDGQVHGPELAETWDVCAGPVAVADVEGDGDLDVFVGGRWRPGRYPEPVSSRLYRQEQGRLVPDTETGVLFHQLGMVTAACWADIDGNGSSDLLVACDWGVVRLFLNDRGRLRDATAEWGLSNYRGLWSGLGVGDFNGDGKLDFVAGNWGLNSPYRASDIEPLRLLYGDFEGRGLVDCLEVYEVAGLGLAPRRDLDVVGAALPSIRGRFTSRKAYAESTIQTILADDFARASELTATTLTSCIFLNQGGGFQVRPLPEEAQHSVVFGVNVGDLDGDGDQDLFLSQNLFATQPEFKRMEGGQGLVLAGDGQGGFSAMTSVQSGIAVYGEQRGSALGDYDGDGRLDLAVARNGGQIALFHNDLAQPGLRVRLSGSTGNPVAVGALVRGVYGVLQGPAHVVTAGSGYGSQDSAVIVLGRDGSQPDRIRVRWPDGKWTTSDVPSGAVEVVIREDGVSPVRDSR